MLKNIERGIYSQWMTFSLLASAAFTMIDCDKLQENEQSNEQY